MDLLNSNPPPLVLPYGIAPSSPPAKLIIARTFGVMFGLIFGAIFGILCGGFTWRLMTLIAHTQAIFTMICKIFGACFLLGALVCGLMSFNRRLGKTYLAQAFFAAMGVFLVLFGLFYLLRMPPVY